ncbi:hypothetical protein C6994_04805 [Klebsiella sp. CVUAS 10191.3]|nr:hypothetical protein [Klebsiella sp. CVUAS 10191.3]
MEAFWRCFPFLLSRASLLSSGAKVKKEAENSSIHACITLSGKKRKTDIEMLTRIKVNVLIALKRKEGDKLPLSTGLCQSCFRFFDQRGER